MRRPSARFAREVKSYSRFICRTINGSQLRICAASSRATSINFVARHHPIHQAQFFSLLRGEIIAGQRELAWPCECPTACGSRAVIPPPGITPTRAWVSANCAVSAAIMMSHASASSNPPVTANPFTAAITGTSMSSITETKLAPPIFAKLRGRKLPQIEAGAKRAAGAGDDDASDFGIGAQLLHGLAEGRAQFRVQGVELLGTIQGNRREAIFFCNQDYRFTHGATGNTGGTE